MTSFTSIDPTTGRTLWTTPATTPEAIEAALQEATETQVRWAAAPPEERSAVLLRLARLLEQDEHELAALMVQEMGKPWLQARAEIGKCASAARYFADNASAMLADEVVPTDARSSGVVYRPVGVVFGIMPWNFPFWQVFRFSVPALMAGNAVVFKHAPGTMGCGERIAALFRKAGAPRGLIQHLVITNETSISILEDRRIAAVTLTGSKPAGRAVAATAGAHLKLVVLELGGSDAFIVMPSADLDAAAQTVVQSRVGNNGQSCIAAKRLIVHASVAEPLLARVRSAFAALQLGDPMDESVDIGPLASAEARAALHAQVESSVAAGARLELGGVIPPSPGFFYPPTLLTDVPRDSAAACEELFGPVLSVFTVADWDEAVALANDSSFGLAASVWTHDPEQARDATERLAVGAVFVNAMSRSDARLPFGGTRESGFGRELGRAGILSFCHTKTYWYA